MTWQTIEHLLSHDEAVEMIKDRFSENSLLLDYAEEMVDVTDEETLAQGILNQMHGTLGQFQYVTAEAIDAFPDQAYQDMIESEFGDSVVIQDDVATAFSAIEPQNESILTFNEVLQTLPYFGIEKPAPITDQYLRTLPTIVTNHSHEMNQFQEDYNKLSSEQRQFLANTAESTERTMIVDSVMEFSHHREQYRPGEGWDKFERELWEEVHGVKWEPGLQQ